MGRVATDSLTSQHGWSETRCNYSQSCVCAFIHLASDVYTVRDTMNDVRVSTKGTESGRLSGAICRTLGCRYELQYCCRYNITCGIPALQPGMVLLVSDIANQIVMSIVTWFVFSFTHPHTTH